MKKRFTAIIAIMAVAAITTAVFASISTLQPKSADASDYAYPSGKPAVAVVMSPGEAPPVVDSDGITDPPGSECSLLAPSATPIVGVRDIDVNSVGTALNTTDPGLPADWL